MKRIVISFLLVLCVNNSFWAQQKVHVVMRGETFATIAAKYGISECELREANPKAPTCITGMKLIVNPKKTVTVAIDKPITTTKPTNEAGRSKRSASSYFEGSLLYRSYEHHSKAVIKYSRGQAYNGERTTIAIVKGNIIHIIDEPLHLHTIVNIDRNIVYIYSDISCKGISAKANEYLPIYRSMLDPDIPITGTKKISTLQHTGRNVTYKGDQCKVYAGQLTLGEYCQTDIEMWYTEKLLVSKSYHYFFFGLPVDGIIRKGIITQSGYASLIGELKSTMAYELMALSEYDVDDKDIQPPLDVKFENMTGTIQLDNFLKNNYNILKKKKLLPKPLKTSEVNYKLRNEWDFADEWLAKEYKLNKTKINWGKIGTNLFETLTSLSSIGGNSTSDITSGLSVVGETIADISGESFSPVTLNNESGDYSNYSVDFSEEIDEGELSPEAKREIGKIKQLQRRNLREQKNCLDQKEAYQRMKANAKANEYRNRFNELKKEFVELDRQRVNIIREDRRKRRQIKESEAAKIKREATEEEIRKRREAEMDNWTKRQNESDYRSGEGLKLGNWYNDDKQTILSIKNKLTTNQGLSINQKRRLILECQQRMKERRKEYKKYAGQDIIGADDALENWIPQDKDLVW